MIEGIEPLYEQIAESIQEGIPEEWMTAKIEAVFFPDAIEYHGEYTRSPEPKVGRQMNRFLRRKAKSVSIHGASPWH